MPFSEKEKQKRDNGRPTKYSKDLAETLCAYLAQGYSLKKTCEQEGMPTVKTVFNWFRTQEGFLQLYTRAKEESADAWGEEIIDIADEAAEGKADNNKIAKAKLRIDTRKFLMAKMKPKRYGDKLDLTSDGKALPTPIYGGLSGKSSTDKK